MRGGWVLTSRRPQRDRTESGECGRPDLTSHALLSDLGQVCHIGIRYSRFITSGLPVARQESH
jgi:hypothetical protein